STLLAEQVSLGHFAVSLGGLVFWSAYLNVITDDKGNDFLKQAAHTVLLSCIELRITTSSRRAYAIRVPISITSSTGERRGASGALIVSRFDSQSLIHFSFCLSAVRGKSLIWKKSVSSSLKRSPSVLILS